MTHPDIVVEIDYLTPEKRYPLKSLAERLAALRPTRVIVNHGGPGEYVMQILRDHGLPVEVMKKTHAQPCKHLCVVGTMPPFCSECGAEVDE